MSHMDFYGITGSEIEAQKPFLVGQTKWECSGGATVEYKGDDWADEEIAKARLRIAQIEAIRLAQVTVDHCRVLDKAEELCQVMYGQTLEQFERTAHYKFVRGLFLAAQYGLKVEDEEIESLTRNGPDDDKRFPLTD